MKRGAPSNRAHGPSARPGGVPRASAKRRGKRARRGAGKPRAPAGQGSLGEQAGRIRMPEALRLSGVDERKLAAVLHGMLDGQEYTPTERKWAAEECLKLLAAYPPRDEEVPVQIVVDLPAPAREAPQAPAEVSPEVQSAVRV